MDDEKAAESLISVRYRRAIRKGEMNLLFAQDGGDALSVIENNNDVMLVFTDINMPNMDGLSLLENIRSLGREVLVVIISAYNDMPNIRRAMNLGAFDFLTKPIDFDDLDKTMQKALSFIASIRERFQLMEEKKELETKNNFIVDTFGRYLQPDLVTMLLARPEALHFGGERRLVTILMSDLRGFTVLSEKEDPEAVVQSINYYFGEMIDIILHHQGLVEELAGDGILVLFGAPFQHADDAERAVACALKMQMAMPDVNRHLRQRGLVELSMGIGINTGEVILGNIGSKRRAKYTVMGHHVNLTARIESCTVGGQILISERTFIEVGPDKLLVDKAEEISAKGIGAPVKVRTLRGFRGSQELILPEEQVVFEQLAEPIAMEYVAVEGSTIPSHFHPGLLVERSTNGARILAKGVRFQQICIRMLNGIVYAKVTEVEASLLQICFTSIPDSIRQHIQTRDIRVSQETV